MQSPIHATTLLRRLPAFLCAAYLACLPASARAAVRPPVSHPSSHGEGIQRSAHGTSALQGVELKPPALLEPDQDNAVFIAGGKLQPGMKETKSFVLPKLARINVNLLGKGVSWSFRAPGGEVILPGKTDKRPGYNYGRMGEGWAGFGLDNPEAGTWTVVSASLADTAVAYAIIISAEGPAEEAAHLEVLLRDSTPRREVIARPGDQVFVRAFVAKHGQPLADMPWVVRAMTPRDSAITIPVFDDGNHSDGKAGDGVFVGGIVAPAEGDGRYRLLADVRTRSGVQYRVARAFEVRTKKDLLIADSIVVSPNPTVRKPVTLTVTVKNDGTVEFRNAKFELSVGGAVDGDRAKMSEQLLDLKPGESRRIVTTWVPQQPVTYNVWLTLTSPDEPYWSSLSNNMRRTIVSVQDAPSPY